MVLPRLATQLGPWLPFGLAAFTDLVLFGSLPPIALASYTASTGPSPWFGVNRLRLALPVVHLRLHPLALRNADVVRVAGHVRRLLGQPRKRVSRTDVDLVQRVAAIRAAVSGTAVWKELRRQLRSRFSSPKAARTAYERALKRYEALTPGAAGVAGRTRTRSRRD